MQKLVVQILLLYSWDVDVGEVHLMMKDVVPWKYKQKDQIFLQEHK